MGKGGGEGAAFEKEIRKGERVQIKNNNNIVIIMTFKDDATKHKTWAPEHCARYKTFALATEPPSWVYEFGHAAMIILTYAFSLSLSLSPSLSLSLSFFFFSFFVLHDLEVESTALICARNHGRIGLRRGSRLGRQGGIMHEESFKVVVLGEAVGAGEEVDSDEVVECDNIK